MKHSLITAFGYSQLVVLGLIIVAVVWQYLRQKNSESAGRWNYDEVYNRKKTNKSRLPTAEPQGPNTQENKNYNEQQIESALPTWSADTPPHEILNLTPSASLSDIESAYKTLLKKYHPDRFASWGTGYQARAHQTVILLQEAKDKMIRNLPKM